MKKRTQWIVCMMLCLALSLFGFAACTTDGDKVTSIQMDGTGTVEYTDGALIFPDLIVTKGDGTTSRVKLTREMISDEDFNSLSTVGRHTITVNYAAISTDFTLTIVGQKGDKGDTGADGLGISKLEINANGELVVTYTDGSKTTVGRVVGDKGDTGSQGPAGEDGDDGDKGDTGAQGPAGANGIGISDVKLENGNLIITDSARKIYNLGSVKGDKGETGSQGDKGEQGETGAAGVGIADITMNANGEIVITYTDPAKEPTILKTYLTGYTVEFRSNGTLLSKQTVKDGYSAAPPASPEGEGGTRFIGWDKSYLSIEKDTVINAVFDSTKWYSNNSGAKIFTLNNASDLFGFARLVNAGTSFADKTIRLGADVDLMGIQWNPIRAANGQLAGATFEGATHKILNLKSVNAYGMRTETANYELGFFAHSGSDLKIQNVTFVNPYVSGKANIAGIVVGRAAGRLTLSNVNIDNGTLIANNKVGMFVGMGEKAAIINVTDCSSSGTLTAQFSMGGVAGLAFDGTLFCRNVNLGAELKVAEGTVLYTLSGTARRFDSATPVDFSDSFYCFRLEDQNWFYVVSAKYYCEIGNDYALTSVSAFSGPEELKALGVTKIVNGVEKEVSGGFIAYGFAVNDESTDQAVKELIEAKASALETLATYDVAAYNPANAALVALKKAEAISAVKAAETVAEVTKAINDAKAALDEIKRIEATVSVSFKDSEIKCGTPAEFTVTLTASNAEGVLVKGAGTFSDESAIDKLEYYEVKDGKWYELAAGADFGASGFPLTDGGSTKFRVTFGKVGTYDYTMSIQRADGGKILASATKSVSAKGDAASSAELVTAIQNAKADDTIYVAAGTYALGATLVIDKNLSIIGAGKDKTELTAASTVFQLTKSNISLNLEGLSIENTAGGGYGILFGGMSSTVANSNLAIRDCDITADSQGIRLKTTEQASVTLENTVVKCNFYALNFGTENEGAAVLVNNSTLEGWAAINSYANNSTITVTNSTLSGTNTQTGETNDFSVIVFDGFSFDKVPEKKYSTKVVVSIKDSKILCTEKTDNHQQFVSFQYGATDCKVSLENTTVEAVNQFGAAFDPVYATVVSSDKVDCPTTGSVFSWEGTEYKLDVEGDYFMEDGKLTAAAFWDGEKLEALTVVSEDVYEIGNAAQLAQFKADVNSGLKLYAGKTVRFAADVNLAGAKNWTSIYSKDGQLEGTTIDGQGHTIRNMSIKPATYSSGGTGFIGMNTGKLTVKNLNFDRAYVGMDYFKIGMHYVGIVMGQDRGGTVFENVSVTNSQVHSFGMSGMILGSTADSRSAVAATQFINCESIGNMSFGIANMGGIVGIVNTKDVAVFRGCKVANNGHRFIGTKDYPGFDQAKDYKYVLADSGTYYTQASGLSCFDPVYAEIGTYSYGDYNSYDLIVNGEIYDEYGTGVISKEGAYFGSFGGYAEEAVEINTEAEFYAALDAGKSVWFGSDISLSGDRTVALKDGQIVELLGHTLTLDGVGFTIAENVSAGISGGTVVVKGNKSFLVSAGSLNAWYLEVNSTSTAPVFDLAGEATVVAVNVTATGDKVFLVGAATGAIFDCEVTTAAELYAFYAKDDFVLKNMQVYGKFSKSNIELA